MFSLAFASLKHNPRERSGESRGHHALWPPEAAACSLLAPPTFHRLLPFPAPTQRKIGEAGPEGRKGIVGAMEGRAGNSASRGARCEAGATNMLRRFQEKQDRGWKRKQYPEERANSGRENKLRKRAQTPEEGANSERGGLPFRSAEESNFPLPQGCGTGSLQAEGIRMKIHRFAPQLVKIDRRSIFPRRLPSHEGSGEI